ncbi:hypothetical protein [Saccharothrix syringae]|uniref:Uncharacterized protein n=1 Tax=Saccharothrix syringae TaxID=103733 RepID=A0A5Q0GVR0_SACSY|nr:hypothetical protein [Saccharothrix syringae]QFZ18011.1 hypothetical protein EKG83_11420 [Saccharothrix syringae]
MTCATAPPKGHLRPGGREPDNFAKFGGRVKPRVPAISSASANSFCTGGNATSIRDFTTGGTSYTRSRGGDDFAFDVTSGIAVDMRWSKCSDSSVHGSAHPVRRLHLDRLVQRLHLLEPQLRPTRKASVAPERFGKTVEEGRWNVLEESGHGHRGDFRDDDHRVFAAGAR